MLVKVRADAETRGQVLETVQLFRAKVVDVAPDAVTIEATGNADKLRPLLRRPRAVRHPRARAVRAWSPSAAAPRSITDRAASGPCRHRIRGRSLAGHTLTTDTPHCSTTTNPRRRADQWLRCSTTTTPTCPSSRAARSPSSATAARATPTR